MSDLEDRIRDALSDPRHELRTWPDPMPRIRRSAWRQRARLAASATVSVAAVTVIAVLAAGILPGSSRHIPSGPAPSRCAVVTGDGTSAGQATLAGPVIRHLVRPGPLAAGSHGQIYVADDGLDQILQVLPNGGFRVIAGNGRTGFSGDGGPAVSASLNDPGGMTVAPNGTIYFADSGNNRIRAVSAAGIITTVAGDGRFSPWIANATPALAASLDDPADVTAGPGGCLYIADEGASQVLRLTPEGQLVPVAGSRGNAGITGIGQLATRASADAPNGLAFDRAGNLYIAGAATKTLLMVTASARMRLPAGRAGFYPHGVGGLARGPGGEILAMNGQLVQKVTARGLQTLLDFSSDHPAGLSGFLPNGIAAVGTFIYLDTYAGNGYTSKTAIIEIKPDGSAKVIWHS